MEQSLEIYSQMDWWNPHHSLLRMVKFKFDYFHEKFGSFDGAKILDIGCGGGLMAEEFAKRGAQVTGLDLSQAALQIARDHAAAGGLKIDYVAGSAEELPFDDATFDGVMCIDCLEHVNNLERVIEQISRVIKNDGMFCYDTFNRNFLSKIIVGRIIDRQLRREYRSLNVTEQEYAVHDPSMFIKPKELHDLMSRNGLANQETKGVLPGRGGLKVGGRPLVMYIGYAKKMK